MMAIDLDKIARQAKQWGRMTVYETWDKLDNFQSEIDQLKILSMELLAKSRTMRKHIEVLESCTLDVPVLPDEFWSALYGVQNDILRMESNHE